MRISTSWAQQYSINAMINQQTKLAKIQQQISSGLKVAAPAEDPAAAVRILDLEASIAKTNQFQSNISTVRARLNLEESALENANDMLDRARELTIQAKNDAMGPRERQSIKYEIDQLLLGMVEVANTQNANGEFIFSGDLGNVRPFEKNPVTGEFTYQGGPHQRVVQISPTRQVADGDLGFDVFENIDSISPAANEDGKRSVFNTLKSLSEALGASLNPNPAEITGGNFLRYGLDYSGLTVQFDLVSGAVTAPINLSNKQFTDVNGIVTEINNQLTAGGYSGAIKAQSNGNKIEFASVATGATANIQINNVSGTFLTDAGFSNGQNMTGASSQTFQDQLAAVINDLKSAQDSFLEARTSVGARLNALDHQDGQNEKFVLDSEATLSDTKDLDYASAISKFQLQSTSLQAAQQAFAKIKILSLFNYL
jgi:flagellar hook-associated protein 3 FlgL